MDLSLYKDYVRSKVIKPGLYEVEVRFTEYSQKRGISLRTYNRLVEYYGDKPVPKSGVLQTDYIIGNIRKTVRNEATSWLKKVSVWDSTLPQIYESYKLKFDISEETTFTPDAIILSKFSVDKKITRTKNRLSYEIVPGLRLDITKVNMSDESGLESITYEIELELLNISSINEWIKQISNICKLIQDTELLYPKKEYRSIISHINMTLLGKDNEDDPDLLLPGLLVQAKNFKFYHITQEYASRYNYRITIKADGIRKMLVYANASFYLVMSPSEINKLVTFNEDIFGGRLEDLIMEGELIPKERKRETYVSFEVGKYYYLIFDLLRIKTVDQIQKKSHSERLLEARRLLDTIRIKSNTVNDILFNGLITIQVKDFRTFGTSEDLFRTVRNLEIDKLTKYYNDDGYIIMPDNVSYDRLGKSGTDILKWKPFDKLTIDLAISWRGTTSGKTLSVYSYSYNTKFIEIYVTHDDSFGLYTSVQGVNIQPPKTIKSGDIIFNVYYPSLILLDDSLLRKILSKDKFICKGKYSKLVYTLTLEPEDTKSKVMSSHELQSRIRKHQDIMVELRTKLTDRIIIVDIYSSGSYVPFDKPVESKSVTLDLDRYPTFTVVEFSWELSQGILTPVLIRKDKELPNEKNVAEDVWESIINPIELSTLMGESTQLLRKYHNTIKRRLLSGDVNGIPFIGGNLLDLGSGAGGDVSKWERYSKIICVEPNIQYISELVKRIKNTYDFEAKVYRHQSEYQGTVDKIIIINTGAENHELISYYTTKFFNGTCNVISAMLSLSFLATSTLYQGLIKTIDRNLKKGGYFIYLTIDGDLVTQLFDPLLKGPSVSTMSLLNGKILLEYDPLGRTLFIDLPGSVTVSKQTEALVFLDDIRLSLNTYKDIGWYRADQELYMNTSERMLSSLYSYGGFLKD